jgi:hypothetical protein
MPADMSHSPSAPATRRLHPAPAPHAQDKPANHPFDRRLRAAWQQLRWPLPALITWAAAWGLFGMLHALGADTISATAAAASLGVVAGLGTGSSWRGWIVAAGFPLSMLLQALAHGLAAQHGKAMGAAAVPGAWWSSGTLEGGLLGTLPAWAWLVPLAGLALAYPMRAWRDAPFFPTPTDALEGLDSVVDLPVQARVLDAGCGLGHGLQALRQVYPRARLHGTEWSWPLRWLAALRCPWATIRRGDMWAESWQGQDLVYLFQRPESMPRAVAKARQEMAPGSWLVSLEFKAPGLRLHAVLQRDGARPVWVYSIGPKPATPRRAR